MMKDGFGNYVIQKLLDVTEGEQRAQLVAKVKPQLLALKRYTYGKHLASSNNPLCPFRLTNSWTFACSLRIPSFNARQYGQFVAPIHRSPCSCGNSKSNEPYATWASRCPRNPSWSEFSSPSPSIIFRRLLLSSMLRKFHVYFASVLPFVFDRRYSRTFFCFIIHRQYFLIYTDLLLYISPSLITKTCVHENSGLEICPFCLFYFLFSFLCFGGWAKIFLSYWLGLEKWNVLFLFCLRWMRLYLYHTCKFLWCFHSMDRGIGRSVL